MIQPAICRGFWIPCADAFPAPSAPDLHFPASRRSRKTGRGCRGSAAARRGTTTAGTAGPATAPAAPRSHHSSLAVTPAAGSPGARRGPGGTPELGHNSGRRGERLGGSGHPGPSGPLGHLGHGTTGKTAARRSPGVTGHARATPAPPKATKWRVARATPAPCPRHARASVL
eukprot:gene13111-biopygen474